MKALDYLFYRVALWLSVRRSMDGTPPDSKAIMFIALMLTILLLDFAVIFDMFSFFSLDMVLEDARKYVTIGGSYTVCYLALRQRYVMRPKTRGFESLKERRKDESIESRYRRGEMIFFAIIGVFVFGFVFRILTHSL